MTLPSLHPDTSPEAMTRRARWYLSVAGVRHLAVGLCCLTMPWLWLGATFIPILNFVPVWAWGAVMAVCGFLCVLSAFLRSGDIARWAMTASATITFVLAVGVWFGIVGIWWDWAHHVEGVRLVSPLLPILLTALAAKDFIVCAQPIRSPFEGLVRQLIEE